MIVPFRAVVVLYRRLAAGRWMLEPFSLIRAYLRVEPRQRVEVGCISVSGKTWHQGVGVSGSHDDVLTPIEPSDTGWLFPFLNCVLCYLLR